MSHLLAGLSPGDLGDGPDLSLSPLLEHSPRNPFRCLAWRWERAGALADKALLAVDPDAETPAAAPVDPLLDEDDPWVRRAYQVRRAWAERYEPTVNDRILDLDPVVFFAYRAWVSRDNASVRSEIHGLEAGLLAGRGAAEIAVEFVNLDPEVAQAYSALFYDIVPLLAHPITVINRAIGEAAYRGTSDRNFEIAWKLIAYNLGPIALNDLARVLSRCEQITDPLLRAATFKDIAANNVAMKQLLASTKIPVNELTAPALLASIINRKEPTEGESGAGGTLLTQNLQQMFLSLRTRVAGFSDEPAPLAALQTLDHQAVELSTADLLQLGQGAGAVQLPRPAFPGRTVEADTLEKKDAAAPETS